MILLQNIGKQIISFTLISFFCIGCNNGTKTVRDNTKEQAGNIAEAIDPNCVEFIALWPAGDIAKMLGKERKWVFLNYTVDLWDAPPSEGKGDTVGLLRASSYARIIEKRGDDYKVESPINEVHGWINKEHVKTISKKNPKTKKLCE